MISETAMLERFEQVRRVRDGDWLVTCPAHADRTPSLHITLADDRWLLDCKAGCAKADVLAAAQLEWSDLFAENGNGHHREIVATYPYVDEAGELLYEVCRFHPKDFRQRRPDGVGGWVWNLQGTRRVLYRLPRVLEALGRGEDIMVVEGEKDADALHRLGIAATCNPAGAGKWRTEYTETLAGGKVTIVADRDEPGRAHADQVAEALQGVAATVDVVEPAVGKDISDHLAAGKGIAELGAARKADPVPSVASTTPRPGSSWPDAPGAEAFYGTAGEAIRLIEPHSEADPAALLVQLLAAFGNACGRGGGFQVEGSLHPTNLYVVLVGPTAKGRKGTSWGRIRQVMELADLEWATHCGADGLSSGEGLIHAVRDPVTEPGEDDEAERVVVDAGAPEKRLMIQEGEFAGVLRRMAREGNTLSQVIRTLWDTGNARTLTKANAERVTKAHVSIVGHITREELRRELTATDAANGFANRFLFVCATRSKVLPRGGALEADALTPVARRLRDALRFASVQGPLDMDPAADALWAEVYPHLSDGRPGLFGAVTGRAEAQTLRLAVIFALLDLSGCLREEHLRAALAVWLYCADSARHVFGASLGHPLADKLLPELKAAPAGLSRSDIRQLVGGRVRESEIDEGLRTLAEQGLAHEERVKTGGRPEERWHYQRSAERTERTEERSSAGSTGPVASVSYVSSTHQDKAA